MYTILQGSLNSAIAQVVERRYDDYGGIKMCWIKSVHTLYFFIIHSCCLYTCHISTNLIVKLIFKIEFADIFPKFVDSRDLSIQ